MSDHLTPRAPQRISSREVPLFLTGYFMPTRAPKAPLLIGMHGTDDLFISVFSTREKLVAAMTQFGLRHAGVSIITNGGDLIDEIKQMNKSGERPYRIRLAVDPYTVVNGRLRFTEALLDEGPSRLVEVEE